MPEGAVIFPNNAGTAPGCAIEDGERGKIIIMLPGPPFELKRMFNESVIPYLTEYTENVFVSKNICIFGMGESECESHLRELMERSVNPTIAPYCGDGEVRLRVTARGENETVCAEACDKLISEVMTTPVGKYVYGVDTTLAERVVKEYTEKGLTLATAESCTGGLIAGKITSVSGASTVLGYGAVTYSEEAKCRMLGVDMSTIERCGVVSPETAEEMAAGIRRTSGADVGVSVTGFAGPGGGTEQYPVGTVFMGVSSKNGTRHVHLKLKGDRDRVRLLTVTNALSQLLNEAKEL